MISVNSRKILALVITIALAGVTAFPAYAQASTITDRVIEPFETVEIACNGEEVFLSGELLLTFHTTFDAAGGIHAHSTIVPRNIRGVGSAGTIYKVVGGDRSHFNIAADSALFIFTETNTFNMVSQEGSDNLRFKLTLHATINANGVESVSVEHFSVTCVG